MYLESSLERTLHITWDKDGTKVKLDAGWGNAVSFLCTYTLTTVFYYYCVTSSLHDTTTMFGCTNVQQ